MDEASSTFWKERQVLVTGATGLLGSAVTAELLRRGATVTTLVRDWIPQSRLVESGLLERTRVVRGELEDFATILRALNEHEIDTVLHLGAQTIVGTAARSPLSTFEANVRGTWTLLEACRMCPKLVQRIVVASSDKAYGIHDVLPYTEDAPLGGRFPYDVSKTCADLITFSYAETYGLPVVVTRCGNLFGPGDLNFNRLVPGTIRSILNDERPLVRSDGTFVRDYFYVQDAVDAYLLLAERMREPEVIGRAFNFGMEVPLSVLEMVDALLGIMGRTDLPPVILNEATHEIPRQYLDCTRAKTVLGWSSRWNLDDALRETIAWYKAHLTAHEDLSA
jgi:CDP-glucose 4,6-dehydratase